jgi:hypothetical protein
VLGYGPSSAAAGAVLTFAAQASGPGPSTPPGGYRYSWDYGDGTHDSGPAVNHTYAAAGTYTVIVTASDSAGDSGLYQLQVNVL